jgi:hypothetical protein
MKEGINVACHLRKTPGGYGVAYEADTGDVVTLFAEYYDARPQGLPSDYWVNDSDYSFQFAAHPKKGGMLPCLNATYGDKEIIRYPNAADIIQFTVQPGRQTLRLLFSVGNSPYDKGKLVEDCGDGNTNALCGMNAEYPVVEITIEGKP